MSKKGPNDMLKKTDGCFYYTLLTFFYTKVETYWILTHIAPPPILSPQPIYFFTKNGQICQNKNFPRHYTTDKWFKAIVSSFWPSYMKFRCTVLKKITKNDIFGAISAQKGVFWIQKKNRKGVFWIIDRKTKTSLFYIYGAKASWKN